MSYQENDDIFNEIDAQLKLKVPLYIKNILIATGFDNEILLKDLSEPDITYLETYVRTELLDCITEECYKQYLGPIYHDHPEKFCIVLGHRKMLYLIRDYFKNKLKTTSDKFTMTETEPNEGEQKINKLNVRYPERSPSLLSRDTSSSNSFVSGIPELLNVDLTKENSHIYKNIKKWVESKCDTKLNEINIDNIKIACSVSEDSRSDSPKQMTCTITCFCGTTIKILKIKKWIYSNYHTHFIRKHLHTKESTNVLNRRTKKNSCKNESDGSITKYLLHHDQTRKRDYSRQYTEEIDEVSIIDNLNNNNNITFSAVSNQLPQGINQDPNEVSNENCSLSTSINEKIHVLHCTTLNNFLPVPILTSENSETDTGCSSKDIQTVEKDDSDEKLSDKENLVENIEENYREDLSFNKPTTSKWSSFKYTRSERNRRKRESFLKNQSFITSYLPVIEKITRVINENIDSTPAIVDLLDTTMNQIEFKDSNESLTRNKFLQTLINVAISNKKRSSCKNIYNDDFKKFALYLFYTGGKLLYETLYANLKNILPSFSTLYRFRNSLQLRVEEGEFNFKGLNAFLDERNLPKIVWVSEDATRISAKIEYDSVTNKVVGFVLPLENGIPNCNAFIATNAEVIESFYKNSPKADYAYAIMAQPLDLHSPAFCISLFGTDNRFTSADVTMRWNTLLKEASIYGIHILGFSSDGDTRLLKAMKQMAAFPSPSKDKPWYHLNDKDDYNNLSFIQDQTHVLTKLRTRLLKPDIVLPMGHCTVNVQHLVFLIENKIRDQHLLCKSDISLEDKMNFDSAKRICTVKIQQLLDDNIKNSCATKIYLKIMNYLIESLIEKNVTIQDRLYKIWYSTFVCRIWRQWIKQHPKYNLQNNFITSNCYTCIEINAHNLVNLIKLFKSRDDLKASMFIPYLFSSQPCESLFRSARSITSTFSTVINFSIKDFMSRIDRISFINYVINDLKNSYIFPREIKRHQKSDFQITDEDILNLNIDDVVFSAMTAAVQDCKNLGMDHGEVYCNIVDIPKTELKTDDNLNLKTERSKNDEDVELVSDEQISKNYSEELCNELENQFFENDSLLSNIGKDDLELKDYSDYYSSKNWGSIESSPFVRVSLANNKSVIIKKSAFCWLLFEGKGKVSVDRLKRFVVNKRKKKSNKDNMPQLGKTQKKRLKTAELDESEIEEENEDIIYNDSTDTESYNEIEGVENNQNNIDIVCEQYYAVHYDERWYIGRVLESINTDSYRMKFLKQVLDTYVWPKVDDIANVNKKYIFYGPINLIGSGPFRIRMTDLMNVNRGYKIQKQNINLGLISQ